MKTVIYVRVSTQEQSTDSQELELKAICQARGWKEVEIIKDVISGKKSARPGLDALMAQVRTGKVERVVCFKLDRLARSVVHLAALVSELEACNVALIVPSQGIDTSTSNPAGRLTLNLLSAVAEFERDIIRERVLAGLKAAKANGISLGRPITHNATPAQVQELAKQGLGPRAIGRQLSIPFSTAAKWLRANR
jgi:DNA invertase Pin-like site-specific DNA recombinase